MAGTGSMDFHDQEKWSFEKTGAQIVKVAEEKIKRLDAKIKERRARIDKICKEANVTAEDIFLAVQDKRKNGQMSYATSSSNGARNSLQGATQGGYLEAGKMDAMETESNLLNAEKEELRRLEMLVRNLDRKKKVKLSFNEVDYLGF